MRCPEIFLSYRRADAAGTAGRLFDRLSQHFGAEQVFRDIDSIEAGDNFEQSIRDALRTATAVLVVIGPRWLDLRRDDGKRRIDDPLDYVRREIELALSSDSIVIPVLVESAVLPAAELLPASLRELTKRNAVELSFHRWGNDIEDFMLRLEVRGIPAVEPPGSGRIATQTAATHGHVVASALAGFITNLFSLLYQPRRFLSRCTQGRAVDLTGAFVFFHGCGAACYRHPDIGLHAESICDQLRTRSARGGPAGDGRALSFALGVLAAGPAPLATTPGCWSCCCTR
jgi:TIR domain